MGTGKFIRMMAAGGFLLTAAVAHAGDTARVESLGGAQNPISSADAPGIRSDRGPLVSPDARPSPLALPQGGPASGTATPFAAPLPPNQLTPAPVLPFNPNGALMPALPAPVHPPNPAR